MSNFLEEYKVLIDELVKLKGLYARPRTYSKDELDDLEKKINLQLPQSHRQFLSAVGTDSEKLFYSSYSIEFVRTAEEVFWQYESVSEDFVKPEPSKDMIFFCTDFNCFFEYYYYDPVDPIVYFFSEGIGFESTGQTFSERIKTKLKNRIQWYRDRTPFSEHIDFWSKMKPFEPG